MNVNTVICNMKVITIRKNEIKIFLQIVTTQIPRIL